MLEVVDLERLEEALAAAQAARGVDAQRARGSRRALGAYFTPAPLVDFVVARALGARLAEPGVAWREDGSPCLRVLDPCAGDGRFLAAAAAYLTARASARAGERTREGQRGHVDAQAVQQAIARQCLLGIERDAPFAELARARTGATIHCREALLDAPPDLAGAVDVVIGNPPYLRSIHLARTDPELWARVQGRYTATSYGEWDLYAAFIEQALAWTAPGGQVGLVVPSRWLTAAFARPLRAALARAGAVRGIVDFGATQIFAGATTYACVLLLARAPAVQVTVARRAAARWQVGQVPAGSLAGAPWRLAVGTRRRLLEHLGQAGPPLGQIARIAKGAGTNADGVFVIEDARLAGGVVAGQSRAGGAVRVEARACRPCLRGRDVRAFGQVREAVQCIVPYREDGTLWTPEELATMPLAAAHLARWRERLEARESGRFAGPRYYCFGRPQNLAFLGDVQPKIVVPDVAREGRALVDARGALVLDSAYAARLRDGGGEYGLALVAAVLNAPVVRLWLRETGVWLRGGYVRLKTAYLASLPLPPLNAAAQQAEVLAAGVLATEPGAPGRTQAIAALSEALREAYGVARADWEEK